MAQSAYLPPPKIWRPILVALVIFLSLGAATVWIWHTLEQRGQRENQRRFDVDMQSIGELVQARMHAYEMVLRGFSSIFAGDEATPSHAQWLTVFDQLRIQDLYPGISSVVWSRYLQTHQRSDFLTRTHLDGRPDYRIFPEGLRNEYLPIEYIGPFNERTTRAVGLDLFSQGARSETIRNTIDSGQAVVSMPLQDVYPVSNEPVVRVGLLMYFPVYKTGQPPDTIEGRRAAFLGMINAAFRGQELAEGIFGAQLRLFQITARDTQSNLLLFDTQHVRTLETPSDWQPQFHGTVALPVYGRTWQLDITGSPEYENGLVSDSHDLVLVVGLGAALLLGLFAAGMIYQHDRQLYASQAVSAQLREQARQLMVVNRYKSEFLANMSHELRTPLNSILILSDQLRQNTAGNLTEKQTRHADIVHRAGSDLLQLINDVLDLAKIEAGRVQLNMEPLNLQDMLVDLDASMRPLAEAKKLHLHIPALSADSGLPQRVYTDRVRLHQILRNLLSNAIKFTDEGMVFLGVSADKTGEDGSVMVKFTVRDTGIGIDPAQHAQAFEAFAQLDGSTRRRFGGTGLGLPITRQLVQALEGDINLQSALGHGTTFTVTLPMKSVPTLPTTEITPPQRSGNGPTLLVVEDDSNFAAIVVEQAQANGFSTVRCMTGQQALELLRSETFAAVILDILLPDISGWQLFRRMRTLPAHRHTPVHIISCLPEPVGLEEDHGTHYLTKPINQDTLNQVFASLTETTNTQNHPTLLLVEDVALEREHYRQQLTAQGFAVTACENAQQARMLWPDTKFDVLVLDLNLPDQDGFSLLGSLDALRSLHGTRVVVNTGLDLNHEGLQRLRGYSAVVTHKRGDDTSLLEQAVHGFLTSISSAVNGYAVTATPPPATPVVPPAAPPLGIADGAIDNSITPAEAPIITDAKPTTEQPTLDGRRLMLVDDDVRNVYAMSALLDDFGLHISTASNGEEAIALFHREPVDLILMDMSMPVMDGYTATNLLKTQHACTIPIIALTAHAMKGDREKCLAAGADDYLAKPVNRNELRSMLERWLQASTEA